MQAHRPVNRSSLCRLSAKRPASRCLHASVQARALRDVVPEPAQRALIQLRTRIQQAQSPLRDWHAGVGAAAVGACLDRQQSVHHHLPCCIYWVASKPIVYMMFSCTSDSVHSAISLASLRGLAKAYNRSADSWPLPCWPALGATCAQLLEHTSLSSKQLCTAVISCATSLHAYLRCATHCSLAATALLVAPGASQATDQAAVGGCLLQKCQTQLAGCLTDLSCFEDLICLNKCNGREDERNCQIKCVYI